MAILTPDIELTSDELGLFEKITFDWEGLDHAAFVRNGDHVVALLGSLLSRSAIPEQRRKWFTDSDFRTGRMKGSRRDLFLRENNTDEEIMRHANFLACLRYLVCGPHLPTSVMSEFREAARRCGHVSSGDVETLRTLARKQTRDYGLPSYEASEEYFKLALDCGVWVSYAFSIRDAVKSIR